MTNTLAIKLGLPELPNRLKTLEDYRKLYLCFYEYYSKDDYINNRDIRAESYLLTLENQRREGIEDTIFYLIADEKYCSRFGAGIISRVARNKMIKRLESALNLKWAVINKAYEGE